MTPAECPTDVSTVDKRVGDRDLDATTSDIEDEGYVRPPMTEQNRVPRIYGGDNAAEQFDQDV